MTPTDLRRMCDEALEMSAQPGMEPYTYGYEPTLARALIAALDEIDRLCESEGMPTTDEFDAALSALGEGK